MFSTSNTFEVAVQNEACGGCNKPTGLLVSAVVTPLPAALPLFASGLGALGLLSWRRKQKAAARAA
jgi:PEP-CTERM motif